MNVLVCGGRDFKDYDLMIRTLYALCDEFELWSESDRFGNKMPQGIRIISGGARGADNMAIDWAVVNWTEFKEYRADWKKHGKAAGPIRNQQMLDEEEIDIVLAFPGGRGTADMVRRARKAGVEVREIT